MPFGLVMSQDLFQQRMDQIQEKCPGTLGIADDIAVYGKAKTEHDKHLHNLMKVARDNGLVFNSEKCAMGQERISTSLAWCMMQRGFTPILKEWKTSEIHKHRQTRHVWNSYWDSDIHMSPFVPNSQNSQHHSDTWWNKTLTSSGTHLIRSHSQRSTSSRCFILDINLLYFTRIA